MWGPLLIFASGVNVDVGIVIASVPSVSGRLLRESCIRGYRAAILAGPPQKKGKVLPVSKDHVSVKSIQNIFSLVSFRREG